MVLPRRIMRTSNCTGEPPLFRSPPIVQVGNSGLSSDHGPGLKHLGNETVDIIAPRSSLRNSNMAKMGQFCTEKLLQSRKRQAENVYGRQPELDTMFQELDRACQKGGRSLVLLQGLSGEGKTALALQLKKPAMEKHKAFFVSGKFDLAQMGEPYSGVKEAMRQLCKEIEALPRRTNLEDSIKTFEDLQDAISTKLSW
jgi:predicted ATP-dependent serine protease